MTDPTSDNPLLDWTLLPAYDEIHPEHVEAAVTDTLKQCAGELDELEGAAPAAWGELMDPLERLGDRIERVWGVVGHLHAVKNSPPLREAYQRMQGEVVSFHNRIGLSRPLYDGYCRLRDGEQWDSYDEARQRVIESAIRDAKLAGVALEGVQRRRFEAINKELAEMSTRFSNNVLDANKDYTLTLTTSEEIEGLPSSLLALAADAARRHGHENATPQAGPWVVTLDIPVFLPFMKHSPLRDLRETLYRAQITKASKDPWDNLPLIDRILQLRREKARLLGYETFAEVSLARKMASSVDKAESLLEQLRTAARPGGERDVQDLRELARAAGAPEADDLRQWDVYYWAERLREQRFDLRDEELRPYFPLPRVLEGMFDLARRLFGIEVRQADGEAGTWHQDVRFFHVHDSDGAQMASLFLDPYSRPAEKNGGAWMNELYGRSEVMAPAGEAVRLPVTYMVCNQGPPVGGKPSLMTFAEVRTLFHEFGHALQHMLTEVDCGPAAGLNNIEWDAVELASQFMENWLFHRPTLASLARHYETDEPLADEKLDRLIEARTFRAGAAMLRQVNFGLFDLELHHRFEPDGEQTPVDVQRRIAAETLVMDPLAEDRFLCSFSHIFAGGYAAGYFSYKWAEVLSADAFAAFEEAGLDDEGAVRGLGRHFRETVLGMGGGRHPMKVFKDFRGREPSIDALFRHTGLK